MPVEPTTQRIVHAVMMSPSVKKTFEGSSPFSTASLRRSSKALSNWGRQYVSGTQTMPLSFSRKTMSMPYPRPHLSRPAHPTWRSARMCASVNGLVPSLKGRKGSASAPHGVGISDCLPQRACCSSPRRHTACRAHRMRLVATAIQRLSCP